MQTAAIYRYGLPGIDQPEAIKTVQFTDEKKLKNHLREMQKGYCEGKERPKIEQHTNPKNNRKVIICQSDADFYYVAHIGLRIKAESNKPTEIIE